MQITVVDPTTDQGRQWLDSGFEAWFAVLDAALGIGRTRPSRAAAEELKADLSRPNKQATFRLLVAGDPADPVGAANLVLPLSENTDFGWLEGGTRPDLLRQGIGSALLAATEQVMRDLGRHQLAPATASDVGTVGPGQPFLKHHGYRLDLDTTRRSWDLTSADLDALAARFAPPPGYRFEIWDGATPSDRVAVMADLRTTMSEDVPKGDSPSEVMVWDAARVHNRDERGVDLGRTVVTAVAFSPDGSPAGYTDLEHHLGGGGEIHQEDTLVVSAHRGRHLAAALKVAATARMWELKPEVRYVDTWNANSNAAMVRTNEALGYLPTETDQEWMKSL